jgi:hypothetical protein
MQRLCNRLYMSFSPKNTRLLAVGEAERAVAGPVRVARAEVVLLVDGVQLVNLLLRELDEGGVVGDARRRDRLRDDLIEICQARAYERGSRCLR